MGISHILTDRKWAIPLQRLFRLPTVVYRYLKVTSVETRRFSFVIGTKWPLKYYMRCVVMASCGITFDVEGYLAPTPVVRSRAIGNASNIHRFMVLNSTNASIYYRH